MGSPLCGGGFHRAAVAAVTALEVIASGTWWTARNELAAALAMAARTQTRRDWVEHKRPEPEDTEPVDRQTAVISGSNSAGECVLPALEGGQTYAEQ